MPVTFKLIYFEAFFLFFFCKRKWGRKGAPTFGTGYIHNSIPLSCRDVKCNASHHPSQHEHVGQAMYFFSAIRSSTEFHGSFGWHWNVQCNEMDLNSELIAPRAFPDKEMDIHSSESWVRLKAETSWTAVKIAMVHNGRWLVPHSLPGDKLWIQIVHLKYVSPMEASHRNSLQRTFWIQAMALGRLYIIELQKLWAPEKVYSIICHITCFYTSLVPNGWHCIHRETRTQNTFQTHVTGGSIIVQLLALYWIPKLISLLLRRSPLNWKKTPTAQWLLGKARRCDGITEW